jgi:predicted RNA-binding protein with PIN domain
VRTLIDGYNLAHVAADLGLEQQVRDPRALRTMLVHLIGDYVQRSGDRVLIVFDGMPSDAHKVAQIGAHAGIEVVFSGDDVEADTLIDRMLKVSTGARETLVVSSDREVRAAAGRYGARSVASDDFFRRVRRTLAPPDERPESEPPEKLAGLSDADVNVWMHIFGFDQEEKRK